MTAHSYIIAARRTALGRIGGLHRSRRIEELTSPLLGETLKDARLSTARIDRVILGNSSADGNPARLVALAGGLPESTPALTIDQQCASGLEAIAAAHRLIALDEAQIVVAGGAEAISMAPWRIAKPRHVHLMPRFLDPAGDRQAYEEGSPAAELGDALARASKISRQQQDDYCWKTHMRAALARDAKRFLKEIVPLKNAPEELRDQSATEPDLGVLAAEPALLPEGMLTAASTSHLHDGAALCVVVSEAVWAELGKPPAMSLIASATVACASREAHSASLAAMRRLVTRVPGLELKSLDLVELSERSAAEAIALRDTLGLAEEALNPDGGAIARGHPLGAAGAVLVTRLFTRMVRQRAHSAPQRAAAVTSATGGQAIAALFEAR